MVREGRLELPFCRQSWILSPVRLPVPPLSPTAGHYLKLRPTVQNNSISKHAEPTIGRFRGVCQELLDLYGEVAAWRWWLKNQRFNRARRVRVPLLCPDSARRRSALAGFCPPPFGRVKIANAGGVRAGAVGVAVREHGGASASGACFFSRRRQVRSVRCQAEACSSAPARGSFRRHGSTGS